MKKVVSAFLAAIILSLVISSTAMAGSKHRSAGKSPNIVHTAQSIFHGVKTIKSFSDKYGKYYPDVKDFVESVADKDTPVDFEAVLPAAAEVSRDLPIDQIANMKSLPPILRNKTILKLISRLFPAVIESFMK